MHFALHRDMAALAIALLSALSTGFIKAAGCALIEQGVLKEGYRMTGAKMCHIYFNFGGASVICGSFTLICLQSKSKSK